MYFQHFKHYTGYYTKHCIHYFILVLFFGVWICVLFLVTLYLVMLNKKTK